MLAKYPQLVPQKEPLTVNVTYDPTELSVDDTLNVNVSVSLNEAGSRVEWGLIDLGIPPGFTVQSEDLAALVERYRHSDKHFDFLTWQEVMAERKMIINSSPANRSA